MPGEQQRDEYQTLLPIETEMRPWLDRARKSTKLSRRLKWLLRAAVLAVAFLAGMAVQKVLDMPVCVQEGGTFIMRRGW